MEKICDIHVHSYYSDGTCAPGELIRLAEATGLSAVALCDHNTVGGLTEFLAAAEGSTVEAVPGIEFSTEYQGAELHILGLFIKPEAYPLIHDRMEAALRRKEQSNLDLVARLRGAGLPLDYRKIKETASGSVNRAVIAAHMVKLGICESVQEAFDCWLSPKCGYYVPPVLSDSLEIIRFIKSIGAVAVLAHPFLSIKQPDVLRKFLSEAEGLDGMEVYYSKFTKEQTDLAVEIAEEFGLLKSGGSDFHGANKPDIAMGTGRGNLVIPLEFLEQLRKRIG